MPYPQALSADTVLDLYRRMSPAEHPFVDEPDGDATAAVFLPFVQAIPPLVDYWREHGGATGYEAALLLIRSVVAQLPDRDGPPQTYAEYLDELLGARGEVGLD